MLTVQIAACLVLCICTARSFIVHQGPQTTKIHARALHAQTTPDQQQKENKFESPLANAANGNLGFQLATAALDNLFKIEPVFENAKDKARAKIIARSNALGENWDERVAALTSSMGALQEQYDNLVDSTLLESTPSYYKSPFHAYKEGNLNWQAAMEVEVSSLAVHSNIYTEDGVYEKTGDDRLRGSFLEHTAEVLAAAGMSSPARIADLGCSTGLSTLALANQFPTAAAIDAVDLSPHMLAVGKHNLESRSELSALRSVITFKHAAAEATGLQEHAYDLVCLCLVAHELPQTASLAILQEAKRLLKPGGALAFMDMDPGSPAFKRMATNPFAFAGFKSTEPWLLDYVSLDYEAALRDAGFINISVHSNSPRHRSVVAFTS